MSVWDDQATVMGIAVKAVFFQPADAEAQTDAVKRVLPFLATSTVTRLLTTESDRRNVRHGLLIAQPDAILSHGQGLITLEYKSVNRRSHTRQGWKREIRPKDMLQAIAGAYAVAQSEHKVTACVLRYHNVAYLLSPCQEVVQTMVDLLPAAKDYYQEDRLVSASQIAEFALNRLHRRFWVPSQDEKARSDAGRVAHDQMLG